MRLSGSYVVEATADKVWDALTDPAALSRCIQGCESLEASGPDEYTAVLNVGIGPIRGRYNGNIKMENLMPHQSFRLSVQGSGSMGFLTGAADVALEERDCSTTIRFEADSQVGGAVARVGQRLMESAANTIIDRFFDCVRRSFS